MTNNIIEEKVNELEKCFGFPTDHKKIRNFVRTALLEVEQAGYTRAMGEAREIVREHTGYGDGFNIKSESLLQALTPTDNNKEV